MVRCIINLENNNRAVYYAGDLLKGTVELHLDEPKKLRGLYFNVYGAAKCHWTETRTKTVGSGQNRRTVSSTVHFKGKDVYLNSKTYLFGSEGGSSLVIQSGIHRYDFTCHLPLQLPASFEALHGNIRYNVEAVLDIPWGFNKEFKLQFTLVRHDDLNHFPELAIPTSSEEVKQFCCCFCLSDPMVITVTLPCSGFTPGQNIPIKISYRNKSNVVVQSTRINLKRMICYNSQTPHHKSKLEVDKMVESYVRGVGASNFDDIETSLSIPQVMLTSNSRYCQVVKVSYELKVEAVVSGCHRNITFKFPIEIGSVPLILNQPSNPSTLPFLSIPNALNENDNVTSPTAPLLESPPPSFDEATKMKTSFEELPALTVHPNMGWNIPGGQSTSAPTDKY